MKFSESWLREWVNPSLSREALCQTLTMAGFEVEDLTLDEDIIDISITPNRGDCLSIKGMSREIAALTRSPSHEISISEVTATSKEMLPVLIEAKTGCSRYVGRVLRHVKTDISTPMWLKERLRQSGVGSISPIVDVTNYVMLELGQPMHAFDLNTINQEIRVRQSKKGEKLRLLDGNEYVLDDKTLLIADHEKPLAIAGVMGGMDSSVTLLTRDIFLESASFLPSVVARQRQYYGLNSDSAYRFERGVDPTLQREAIERATRLILDIVGGEAGPVSERAHDPFHPMTLRLPKDKINAVLGIDVPDAEVEAIFNGLRFQWKKSTQQNKTGAWEVEVPPYRFDMSLPEDLIEEIARLYGYEKIPLHPINAELQINPVSENGQDAHLIRQAFSDQGYHEIISYSFVDRHLQSLLDPEEAPRELLNPITSEMACMRTNLWPGLINALLYNKSRQQHRIRLFEIGACFTARENQESERMGGLMMGLAHPEQWGMPSREADFYDLKAQIENVFSLFYNDNDIVFGPDCHPALHPGQTAAIYCRKQKIGLLGALHPRVLQALDLLNKVFVFEVGLKWFRQPVLHRFHEISKFPEIRRDIAILVNQAIPSKDIQDTIKEAAGDCLKDIFIFDIYQGEGISPTLKSIALALILQHPTRTLVDDEVTALIERVMTTLKGQFGAELRS